MLSLESKQYVYKNNFLGKGNAWRASQIGMEKSPVNRSRKEKGRLCFVDRLGLGEMKNRGAFQRHERIIEAIAMDAQMEQSRSIGCCRFVVEVVDPKTCPHPLAECQQQDKSHQSQFVPTHRVQNYNYYAVLAAVCPFSRNRMIKRSNTPAAMTAGMTQT